MATAANVIVENMTTNTVVFEVRDPKTKRLLTYLKLGSIDDAELAKKLGSKARGPRQAFPKKHWEAAMSSGLIQAEVKAGRIRVVSA